MDLNVNLSQILRNNGYTAVKGVKKEALDSFLERMKPVSTARELIRVGGYGDGGYLVPDDLEGIEACFSPGVADVANFESEMANRGIKSFMADFSVEAPPVANPLFDFEKKYLGDTNNQAFIRLEDWVKGKVGAETKELILQMDIEGNEYQVILDTPQATLKQFRMMVIEFHGLDQLLLPQSFNFLGQAFTKLLKDFCIVHIHPNNYWAPMTYGEYEIPPALEITLYRKDRVVLNDRPPSFPHILDSKNIFNKPEVVLPECWRKDLNHIDDFLRTIYGVIHVGGSVGQEHHLYDKHGLSVIWIEALDSAFQELTDVIQELPNQVAFRRLITDRDSTNYPFYVSNNQGISSSIFKPTGHKEIWPQVTFDETIELESSTLSTLFKEEKIDVSLYQALVLDTQGSELLVLKGLGDLITTFKYIKTEATDFEAYEGCCLMEELDSYLTKFGFKKIITEDMTDRAEGGNFYDILYARES